MDNVAVIENYLHRVSETGQTKQQREEKLKDIINSVYYHDQFNLVENNELLFTDTDTLQSAMLKFLLNQETYHHNIHEICQFDDRVFARYTLINETPGADNVYVTGLFKLIDGKLSEVMVVTVPTDKSKPPLDE